MSGRPAIVRGKTVWRSAQAVVSWPLLDLLTKAAEAGEPCPSMGRMAAAIGCANQDTAHVRLCTLLRNGLIAIAFDIAGRRVVTITATGKATASAGSAPADLRRAS